MTIALTGGGTAGHVLPALALIPQLYKHYSRIIFIGGDNPLEKRLVEEAGIKFYAVENVPFSREKPLENVKIPFKLSRGVKEAKDVLKSEGVEVVFVKGGYASLPAAFAARSLNLPVVVHESDYTLGLANKVCASFASSVITSFPETRGGKYVGSPIRAEVYAADKERARREYGLGSMPVVTFCGGSLGAEAINNVVRDALPVLTKKYQVIHLSGKGYIGKKHQNYHEIAYSKDIFDIFAASEVVISRAGANTLAELATLGKRTIAVPLPKGNSRGDQVENAKSYLKRGYLTVLEQKDLSVTALMRAIDNALRLPSPKPMSAKDVNERIVEEIVSASKK